MPNVLIFWLKKYFYHKVLIVSLLRNFCCAMNEKNRFLCLQYGNFEVSL